MKLNLHDLPYPSRRSATVARSGVVATSQHLAAQAGYETLRAGGSAVDAAVARQGLGQALSELVGEGWLRERDALALVEPLMRGNARDLFPIFGRDVGVTSRP